MKHRYILSFLLSLFIFAQGCASSTPPESFNTPDDAVNALVNAARSHSADQLKQILGGASDDIISSGDAVADHNAVDGFLAKYDEKHQFKTEADGSVTLAVGSNEWPMPIPLVKDDQTGKWHFDTERGKDEMINRRIGRNELDAIQVCLAIADAQREYATRDPEHTGVAVYAEKFLSDPGKKNGLFWKTGENENPSPLGLLVIQAAEQGYTRGEAGEQRPYHGYFYRILKAQGSHATGGERNYIINGRMVGGFGVVAYPADYKNSGVMSFIVNHDGVVYQRDLGMLTSLTAKSMSEFDPGPDWEKVDSAEAAGQ
jgi:hypothetical protein